MPSELQICMHCGEEYRASLKRCPECGAKSAPNAAFDSTSTNDRRRTHSYQEESCTIRDIPITFQGKESTRPTGRKPRPINWMRVVVFCFTLVLLATALAVFFFHVYPQLCAASNEDPTQADDAFVDTEDEIPVLDYIPGTTTEVATGITLDQTDLTLETNDSCTLKATVTPGNWVGTITWTTSNTRIATVNANGTVTNVNTSGQLLSATITATASDGITASIKVYCRGGSTPQANNTTEGSSNHSSLTLNREDFTLVLGRSDPFTMKVTSGETNITWSISDTSVATIDEHGKVTAVGKGKATITATAHDGSTATCIVRVRTP